MLAMQTPERLAYVKRVPYPTDVPSLSWATWHNFKAAQTNVITAVSLKGLGIAIRNSMGINSDGMVPAYSGIIAGVPVRMRAAKVWLRAAV
jgi:hypothetical protein